MSTNDDNYDLIVIGAGMAGNAAANKCAQSGWRVAIVDELPCGGTCALRVVTRRRSCGAVPRSSTAPAS
jgi:succinate dehydrogenase/fumarate reductase flavoprotein subunit